MGFIQFTINGALIPMWGSRRKIIIGGRYKTSEVQIVYKDGKYKCLLMYTETMQRVKIGEYSTFEEAKMKAFE